MTEIRVKKEGTLRWVQASGTGNAWATASAPASGTIGFVQDFSVNAGDNYTQIFNNDGTVSHHKHVGSVAPQVSFSVLHGVTAEYPVAATARGSKAT